VSPLKRPGATANPNRKPKGRDQSGKGVEQIATQRCKTPL